MMLNIPLILLVAAYLLILALSAFLIRNWIVVPEASRGPRFKMFRWLNVVAIVLACLAAITLTTGYYIGKQISFAGLPIVILLFVSCSFSKRFENK